jgi:cysteine desulfurase
MKTPVYMDYQATTPVDPRVLDAMIPFFTEKFGNPSSRQHRFGWEAEDAVERARATIARAIGAEAREIIFTSGATESNNLALKGVAGALRSKGDEIVTVATEHKSVLDAAHRLAGDGFRVTILPVDADGVLDPADLRKAITEKTVLVSVMAANNEIGTLQDMPALAEICRERKVLFHSDATQAVGKIPVDLRAIGCDFLSFTGHKLYGPKGVGCLVVRTHPRQVRLLAQIDGGGHERGFRSGTLNVPGIVGLAKAVELAVAELGPEAERLRALRDRMWHRFRHDLGDVALNGHATKRLPGNLNVSFLQVDENTLMMEMKDLAVSTGSACTSTSPEPSHVLKALGIGTERMHSAIRFGLGRFTTEEEVDYATERVIQSVKKLRSVSQSYRQQQTPVH